MHKGKSHKRGGQAPKDDTVFIGYRMEGRIRVPVMVSKEVFEAQKKGMLTQQFMHEKGEQPWEIEDPKKRMEAFIKNRIERQKSTRKAALTAWLQYLENPRLSEEFREEGKRIALEELKPERKPTSKKRRNLTAEESH